MTYSPSSTSESPNRRPGPRWDGAGAIHPDDIVPGPTVPPGPSDRETPRRVAARRQAARRIATPEPVRRNARFLARRPDRPGTRHRPERRPRERSLILALALNGLALGMALLVACTATPIGAALVAIQAQEWAAANTMELPEEGPLDTGLPQTGTIEARDGTLLNEIIDIGYGRRTFVPLRDMSPHLIEATLATEDSRFREHPGVDIQGLARAVAANAQSGGASEGASTIEMQLVRNLYLADEMTEQTIARKVKEALAALELDRRFSKEELLEAYLNVVYYGHRAFGAEAAARVYFGKSARDLTLAEASLIAGLPQSPTNYDPHANLDAARARQREVLDRMVAAGAITPEQAFEALTTPVELKQLPRPEVRAPHWVNYIRALARQHWGPERVFTGGLSIHTTIDLEVQQLAEQIVAQNEEVRQKAQANNSAMVVIDPATGYVLAMVGSKDFANQSINGQVNVATALRQPGSSIKPLVYLSGFERGLNPAVEVMDQPTDFAAPPGQPPYRPENYDNHYFGRVTIRDALGNSMNIPAVKVLKFVGVPAFQDLARRLGITSLDGWDRRWLSLTLGGGEVSLLEMTGAYTTLARGGNRVPIETIVNVTTSRGETLHQTAGGRQGEQVVDPRLVYQLLHVMGDPGARLGTFGPNTPLNLPRPHMVKTGTTDDYRDTWTIGCVPQVCVGVWMGNTDNRPMVKVSSSLTAGKIWVDMMNALIERNRWEPLPWPQPDGVVVKRIPNTSGARPGMADYEEVFLAGREDRPLLEMDWMAPIP